MDLRVYVDGVARIICDLTRTTTVHDIIIALAQYKGKAGRYSLIERAPDGTQRALSPNELTHKLSYRPDWTYILKENPSNSDLSHTQKRSKSLDGRKTPVQQQSIVEIPSAVTSSASSSSSSSSTSGLPRTVHNNNNNNNNNNSFATISSSSSLKSSEKKKHLHLTQIFPAVNINTNNNNNNSTHINDYSPEKTFLTEQKRPSRGPIQIIEQDLGTLDNHHHHHHTTRRSRPKSALPSSLNENSAFRIVHNPNNNHTHFQHKQQYIALIKMLKSQEVQVEQQIKELNEKQKEIDFREKHIHKNDIENELHLLTEHDRRLTNECQMYSEEFSSIDLDKEIEFEKKLQSNCEHLRQQLTRYSTTLEQKRQLQEQIQLNIEQTHEDIEQIQTHINNDKKDLNLYQNDLERSHGTLNQQEDLVEILTRRNDEIELVIQQRRQQINELENELIKLDDALINSLIHPSNNVRPNSSTPQHYNSLPSTNLTTGTSTDVLMPVRLQFVNSTLWKLCPSGIWV